ncbi:hypothetical protein BLNAU_8270 [Blattamonas nauphoetae]|uniref:ABC transporter domain-containing protein n=1 Tax=Blattamonas nauphoetae TaxID=2049346 RepID=A0ABQ9XZB3_9EUKA|nr:hypothetical protein BLNAU_8270 [Blattamonas nauphoetae]
MEGRNGVTLQGSLIHSKRRKLLKQLTQAEETNLKKEDEPRKNKAKLAAAREIQTKPHSKFGGEAHDGTTPEDKPQSNEMQETEVSQQETQSQKSHSQIFQPSVNTNETRIQPSRHRSTAPSRTPTAFSSPMTGAETEQSKKEAEKRKKEARQAAAKREKSTAVPPDQANTEMTQVPQPTPSPPPRRQCSGRPNALARTQTKRISNRPRTSCRRRGTSTAMSGKDVPALSDVSISIPKGSLTMIVESVGCGKSSLGSAIEGDIEKMAGIIRIDGKFTFCPPTLWINNNVRGNFAFNAEFEEENY